MKRVKVASLAGSPVSVWFDDEYEEYQVKVAGNKNATYHTDDKDDALSTAQYMRNNIELKPSGKIKKNPETTSYEKRVSALIRLHGMSKSEAEKRARQLEKASLKNTRPELWKKLEELKRRAKQNPNSPKFNEKADPRLPFSIYAKWSESSKYELSTHAFSDKEVIKTVNNLFDAMVFSVKVIHPDTKRTNIYYNKIGAASQFKQNPDKLYPYYFVLFNNGQKSRSFKTKAAVDKFLKNADAYGDIVKISGANTGEVISRAKKNPIVPGITARPVKNGRKPVLAVEYASTKAGPWTTAGLFPNRTLADDYCRNMHTNNPEKWWRVVLK